MSGVVPALRTDHQPSSYSLRHTVAHLCLAANVDKLETLLLEFDFWDRVYAAGCGPDTARDLMQLAPLGSAVAQDVIRWLRGVNDALVKQPRCVVGAMV